MKVFREMQGCRRRQFRPDSGQSLIETALVVPILLLVTFNAINIGYFCVVAINLASAARTAAQYSVGGNSSSLGAREPDSASVKNLALEDVRNALANSTTVSVRVCSQQVGVNSATHAALCNTYGGNASWPATAVDPEQPNFVLNQVDVVYTMSPIIPIAVFQLQLMPALTYRQTVYMRSMP